MISSLRSWYFVISFLLVRCRSESVALESKDVHDLVHSRCEGNTCLSGSSTTFSRLVRRVTEHTEAQIFATLIGIAAVALVFIVLLLVVYTRIRHKQIQDRDIEARIVCLESERELPVSPSSVKPRRNSWGKRLSNARRKLWNSMDKSSQPAFRGGQPTFNDVKAPLPFPDSSPIQKPPAVLDQSSPRPPRPRRPPRPEASQLEHIYPILMPMQGGVLSVRTSPIEEQSTDSRDRRRVQVQIPSAPPSQDDTISPPGLVAQTIIANSNKPRVPARTRTRKGSLLSAPPLTASQTARPGAHVVSPVCESPEGSSSSQMSSVEHIV